jgi:nicotinamide-nucleotide amidase
VTDAAAEPGQTDPYTAADAHTATDTHTRTTTDIATSIANLTRTVLDLAEAAGLTIAVAESLTAGRLAAALTAPPGASAVFRGSVTAYATELKAAILGVDADLLARNGAVDPEVARQMAAGVRRLCGSDLALATTGVAGPTPQDGKEVGTVYLAVADSAGSTAVLVRLAGDRPTIQNAAVEAALSLMVGHLKS